MSGYYFMRRPREASPNPHVTAASPQDMEDQQDSEDAAMPMRLLKRPQDGRSGVHIWDK